MTYGTSLANVDCECARKARRSCGGEGRRRGRSCLSALALMPSVCPLDDAGLHGSAESLLTVTNLLVVLGLRQGIREEEKKQEAAKQQREQQQEQKLMEGDT